MRNHFEQYFGFVMDPGPHDLDVNRPIQLKIVTGEKKMPEQWTAHGPWFSAAKLDDLIRALQRAKHVLDTECRKDKDGYLPPRRVF